MIPAAWPPIASLAFLAALLLYLGQPYVALVLFLAATFIAFFFRDPERRIPPGDDLVVSPADGRVVGVDHDASSGASTIAIFLSLFNVHVNRSPVSGRVLDVKYRRGSFRPAFAGSASAENERNTLELETPTGRFDVSQIAGIVARRIRCFKAAGDSVGRGERIGYIAFGSRTELTVPAGAVVVVKIGDSVKGGETVVARMPGSAGSGA
jgi:phosphatidylserine decarboxylase